MSKIKSAGKLLLKIGISGGALYLVFSNIEFSSIWRLLKEAQWFYLIPALLFFAFSKYIAAIRLNRFFHEIDIPLAHQSNIKLYLLGMFYNLFLPGGIGGDGYKVYRLNKEYQVTTRKVFLAVLLDRLSGIFALGIMVLFLALAVPELRIYWWLLFILLPIGYYLVLLLLKKWTPYFFSLFPITHFQSFIVQGSQIITAVFILLAIAPEALNLQYLFLFLVSSIVSVIPFTIGGAGARELTFMYGAQFMTLQMDAAVTLSLLFYLITLVVSFFGIFFSIRPLQLHLSKR